MGFEWQTLILGVVQGVAEFLPISSSGHLALLQTRFDFSSTNLLMFDLLLHCATMLAVLLFFWTDIRNFLIQWCRGFFFTEDRCKEGWRYGWGVLLATVTTACVALPLKTTVEAAMRSPTAVGVGLLVTAGILCLVPLVPKRQKELSIRIALFVGLVQGFAVFPGVSRSGATIAAALFAGLASPEAFRLSFLLSVPTILGATLLEGLEMFVASGPLLPDGWFWGMIAAFLLGWLSLAFLRRLVLSGKWPYFGVYCFFLGLFAITSQVMTSF